MTDASTNESTAPLSDQELFDFHTAEADKSHKEAAKHYKNSQSAAFLTRSDNEVNIATYKQAVAQFHLTKADHYYSKIVNSESKV